MESQNIETSKEAEEKRQNKAVEKEAETETFVEINIPNHQVNPNLGITQEYNLKNRNKLWDSPKAKTIYRDEIFGERETYTDPSTGNVLHKSHLAAQRKYHMKNSKGENVSTKWAGHAAETDHIVSIKEAHNRVKNNCFLSDEDFKEIVNSKENFRITSKSKNTSKGADSDWKAITDKSNGKDFTERTRMAGENIRANVTLNTKFATRTLKNAGTEFIQGSVDTVVASAVPLTIDAVDHLCKLASGQESLEEAGKKYGKIIAKTAVVGGTEKIIRQVVNAQMSKNTVIFHIAQSPQMNQLVSVALIVKDSAVRYINGEIDGKEFIEEVGEKGTHMVASVIGSEVGGEIGFWVGAIIGGVTTGGAGAALGAFVGEAVGRVLGNIISSIACSAIIAVCRSGKQLNQYRLKEQQIKRIEAAALREMGEQRSSFRALVENEYRHWDEEIEAGFDMLLSGACKQAYDLQGMTDGLDRILAVFGKSVAFKTLDEYEAQLDQTLSFSF